VKLCHVIMLIVLLAGSADICLAEPQGGWSKNRITLYGWGSRLEGDVSLAPLPPVSVSRSFSDTLSSLDFGAMAAYETRGDRWGLLLDLQTVSLSDRASVPVLGATGRIQTDLDGALVAASYRLHESNQTYLDLIAGLRYWSIDTDTRIQLPPGAELPFPTSARDSRSITTAQLGLKGSWSFENAWFLTGWVMAGAGGNTSLSSDMMVAAGYAFTTRTSLLLGYRRIDIDYDSNRLDMDLRFQGPGIALDYRF